jgi:hypothetical protein
MLPVHLRVWRSKALFSVFSVGLELILYHHPVIHRLRRNIAGLIPIVTISGIRPTSEFPPGVRLPAIRPLRMPTMYTFWEPTDSLRAKALYPLGCRPRVVNKVERSRQLALYRRDAAMLFEAGGRVGEEKPRKSGAASHYWKIRAVPGFWAVPMRSCGSTWGTT